MLFVVSWSLFLLLYHNWAICSFSCRADIFLLFLFWINEARGEGEGSWVDLHHPFLVSIPSPWDVIHNSHVGKLFKPFLLSCSTLNNRFITFCGSGWPQSKRQNINLLPAIVPLKCKRYYILILWDSSNNVHFKNIEWIILKTIHTKLGIFGRIKLRYDLRCNEHTVELLLEWHLSV